MDINNLNQLVSLIQRQRDEYQTDRADGTSPAQKTSKKQPTRRSSPKQRLTPLELKTQIQRRLKNLKEHSDIDEQTARKLFIESVLAWQFGDKILNDPKLNILVSEIDQTYKEHRQLDAEITQLIASLSNT